MLETPLFIRLGFGFGAQAALHDTHEVYLHDPDTRSTIQVTLPNPDGMEAPEHDPNLDIPLNRAADALRKHLNAGLPHDTVAIEIDQTGELLSCRTDRNEETTGVTDYLPLDDFQFPPAIAAQPLLRSDLTEHGRFMGPVDVVAYSESSSGGSPVGHDKSKRYVFKYANKSAVSLWGEVQLLARLPPHPNMVLLDRVVVDEVTRSQVVGFTMRYVAGGQTLDKSRPAFKLRWLRQLIQAVDDLNLKYGVIHQDIADRNLMIDPDTDSITLIDFNTAARVGVVRRGRSRDFEGEDPSRDDGTLTRIWLRAFSTLADCLSDLLLYLVKGVLVFLYEYITRDPNLSFYQLNEVDDKAFKDPARWTKHPDVELDHEVADF